MKEPQIEFVFIGIIILVFALCKISDLIKTRYYEKMSSEYNAAQAAAEEAVKASAPATPSDTKTFLSHIERLIPTNARSMSGPLLSTENFTVDTTENEMTVNQRKKIAPVIDEPAIPAIPAVSAVPVPPSSTGKEGLENPDANTKEFIDKNLSSVNYFDTQSRFKLRDYYIKAAYNAFNPDKFKNSSVSMDACLYVLARGCRFIDFEVFSVDNQPVIASSSVKSFNYKETYNHIPVSDAFEVLGSYAFSGGKCPNPGDPFIIHMRMMSQNVTMYDNMAKIIMQSKAIARNLLGPKYGREYQSKDLGNESLTDLKGKIIFIVDGTNSLYRKTKLFELINMSSNTMFLSKYTYFGVKNVGDPQAFKDANKKNMCLVMPDKGGRPINDGHNGPFTWGCQIAAMCFQDEARDEKLKAYEDKFASVGYAFILKPAELRYVPITIAPPAPPNPKASMEARPAEAAGGVKLTL